VDIYPDVDEEEVHRVTAEHWCFDLPFPTPRGQWLSCPVCASARVQGRTWTRRVRVGHTITGRVDISFKCTSCAAVWTHGVATPDAYAARFRRRPNERIDWREVRDINERYRTQQEEQQ
jgi:hypothetical protein